MLKKPHTAHCQIKINYCNVKRENTQSIALCMMLLTIVAAILFLATVHDQNALKRFISSNICPILLPLNFEGLFFDLIFCENNFQFKSFLFNLKNKSQTALTLIDKNELFALHFRRYLCHPFTQI